MKEKIDLIAHTESVEKLVRSSLKPAEIDKVELVDDNKVVVWLAPDQRSFAFLQVNASSVDLYQVNIVAKKAIRINQSPLNIVLNRYQWVDPTTFLYFTTTQKPTEAPQKAAVPDGPTIQENSGKASPRPTFQDLIKSPYDEQLFSFFATERNLLINSWVACIPTSARSKDSSKELKSSSSTLERLNNEDRVKLNSLSSSIYKFI